MTVNLSALAGAGQQFFDNSGVILSGGKLYSYAAGTTTPQATYTSASGSTAHSNPIILNSAGRVATGEIWLTAGSNYKFVLYTSTDVLIATWDNITGINGTGITSNAVNVTYDPAGAGAVATTVQAKLRESVSVLDFGANTVPGTTDMTAIIQAAHDYIVNSGIPNVLLFPAGTYKCNSGLTINAGFVSLLGDRAVLNFTSLGDVPAITVTGGNGFSGQSYNQADFSMSGFKLLGPALGTATCLYFNQLTPSSGVGPSHTTFRNLNIWNFKYGIRIGNHSYMITFDACDVRSCTIGLYNPTTDIAGNTLIDQGENIRFNNGCFDGCTVGFKNDSGSSDYSFTGTSFDQTQSISAQLTKGQAAFTACHFETPYQALVNADACYMTCTGCEFISNTSLQAGFITNVGHLSIFGGRIIDENNNNTGIITSTGRLVILGTFLQSTVIGPLTLSGPYFRYLPNDQRATLSSALSLVGAFDQTGATNLSGPVVFTNGITTATADYTIATIDYYIKFAGAVSKTITLPLTVGRVLKLTNNVAYAVVSSASNIVSLDGATTSTALLPATAGKWVEIVCDGTYWRILAGN